MAIDNRDLSAAEQTVDINVPLGIVNIAGATRMAWVCPYPVTLKNLKVAPLGVSGSPILSFFRQQFIVGSGATSLPIGISGYVPTAIGTSGLAGFSGLAAAGSTLLNLAAGEVLMVAMTGANSALSECSISFIVKKLQDIKSTFGDLA